MKITCEKHGEVEAHPPNRHGGVSCPKCVCDVVREAFHLGEDIAVDELGYPLVWHPYVPLQISRIDLSKIQGKKS